MLSELPFVGLSLIGILIVSKIEKNLSKDAPRWIITLMYVVFCGIFPTVIFAYIYPLYMELD